VCVSHRTLQFSTIPIVYRLPSVTYSWRASFREQKKSRQTSRACECTYTMTVAARHYPTYVNEEILYIYKHAYTAHFCQFNIYRLWNPLSAATTIHIYSPTRALFGFLIFFSVSVSGSVFIFYYADKMETYIWYKYVDIYASYIYIYNSIGIYDMAAWWQTSLAGSLNPISCFSLPPHRQTSRQIKRNIFVRH